MIPADKLFARRNKQTQDQKSVITTAENSFAANVIDG